MSFAMRAFKALCAKKVSKGMSESVVATGALPPVKYRYAPKGTRRKPSSSPTMNFTGWSCLSEFSYFNTATRIDAVIGGQFRERRRRKARTFSVGPIQFVSIQQMVTSLRLPEVTNNRY